MTMAMSANSTILRGKAVMVFIEAHHASLPDDFQPNSRLEQRIDANCPIRTRRLSQFVEQFRMLFQERHQLDSRAAWFDQASFVFVEGVLADLEQSACFTLREFQLGPDASDRLWRWNPVDPFLERSQRRIHNLHVTTDDNA